MPLVLGILALIGIGISGSHAISSTFILNRTQSVPKGLYRLTAAPLERGALVAYRATRSEQDWLEARGIIGADWVLLKHVFALEGDEVCWRDRSVFVDGEHAADLVDGIDFRAVQGCQMVLSGQVFLLNTHPLSVDGRYFGVQSMSRIVGRAELIWRQPGDAATSAKSVKGGKQRLEEVRVSRRARLKARRTAAPTPLSAHQFFCDRPHFFPSLCATPSLEPLHSDGGSPI